VRIEEESSGVGFQPRAQACQYVVGAGSQRRSTSSFSQSFGQIGASRRSLHLLERSRNHVCLFLTIAKTFERPFGIIKRGEAGAGRCVIDLLGSMCCARQPFAALQVRQTPFTGADCLPELGNGAGELCLRLFAGCALRFEKGDCLGGFPGEAVIALGKGCQRTLLQIGNP
jgi:hypothetical protein